MSVHGVGPAGGVSSGGGHLGVPGWSECWGTWRSCSAEYYVVVVLGCCAIATGLPASKKTVDGVTKGPDKQHDTNKQKTTYPDGAINIITTHQIDVVVRRNRQDGRSRGGWAMQVGRLRRRNENGEEEDEDEEEKEATTRYGVLYRRGVVGKLGIHVALAVPSGRASWPVAQHVALGTAVSGWDGTLEQTGVD